MPPGVQRTLGGAAAAQTRVFNPRHKVCIKFAKTNL